LRRFPWCVVCQAEGKTTRATDVDHIVPRRQGGTDDQSNLMPLCHSHHSQKTAMNDGGFGNRRARNLEKV
jgi:5-methylcytosine-specific restriction protein A